MDNDLSILEVYESFSDIAFVKEHSHLIQENGHKMYTTKVELNIHLLGKVVMAAAYVEGEGVSIPVLFLSTEQVNILRQNGIRFRVKRRKHPTSAEKYLGFPNRSSIERINCM